MGYGVTIYEALPVAGGMMRVGIPAHRLPKGVLQQDIDDILALGVVLAIGAYAGWYRLSGEGRLPAETVTQVPAGPFTLDNVPVLPEHDAKRLAQGERRADRAIFAATARSRLFRSP